ncbi:MAG TPA: ThuA domain-containing protein [Planctomycetota bacterium]|nr:ThuA domain-containing protein [Planctomycetota bacterium]
MKKRMLALFFTALALSAAFWADLSPPPALGEDASPRVKLLIITGSHGHDWKGTLPVMKDLFANTGRFEVSVTVDPRKDLTPENLARHDVFLLHYKETRETPGRWPAEAENALLEAVRGGKGLVVLHYASSAFDEKDANWPEFEKLIGGGWRRSKGYGAHAPLYQFRVELKDRDHPITRGLPASFLHAKDELYHKLLMLEGNHVLAEALDNHEKGTGKKEPLVWVLSYGKGRVFHNALGHAADQMKGPGFQALLARGAEWAATGKVTLAPPASLDSPVEK